MTGDPIEALFFDLGGVIVEFEHFRIAEGMFASARGSTPADPAVIFETIFDPARGLCTDFNAGRIGPEEFHAELCRRFGLDLSYEAFVPIWCEIFREKPGMRRVIQGLAGRVRLFLVSNTDPLHFRYIRETFPVLDPFESCILSYEVGACKPEERIYREALARSGLPASRVLYVDDIPGYVEAARGLGMRGITFRSAKALQRELHALWPEGGLSPG